jgi:hypothetical protein
MQTIKAFTFAALAQREPRLRDLQRAVQAERRRARQDHHYCANRTWFGRFEDRLNRLVGWERRGPEDPILGTSAAYDVAFAELYELLPNCRHEGSCTY